MGGFGSGRYGGKPCTDDMRRLDVRRLQRDGHLRAGSIVGWQWSRDGAVTASIQMRVQADRVWLEYRTRKAGGDWRDMKYPVLFDWTACHLGGGRIWWRCPAIGCGRRCAVLFGGTVFACRQCHRLAYRSQRQTFDDRAMRQADKVRARLGWDQGILNGPGVKPKGMHWRTFERLQRQHLVQSEKALAGLVARLGAERGGLDDEAAGSLV